MSRGQAPADDVQHVDLWWQPAASLEAARGECVQSRLCTGVYWNEADRVFKMLSGAVTTTSAPQPLRHSHSVHTHACSVDEFRRKLMRSGANVVFVVTTVPRTRGRARNNDGTSYFSSHLQSVLSQARQKRDGRVGGGERVGGPCIHIHLTRRIVHTHIRTCGKTRTLSPECVCG